MLFRDERAVQEITPPQRFACLQETATCSPTANASTQTVLQAFSRYLDSLYPKEDPDRRH